MPHDLLTQTYFARRDVLLRYLARLCGDGRGGDGGAEDLLQELYLRLAQVPDTAQIQEPLAFLFRMAANLWLNRRRAGASRKARDEAWHDLDPVTDHEADARPDAESTLGARQELRAVLKDLDGLPPRTRDIFRLHKLEGLSQAEVARRLDISVSAVEKHLSGALRHLVLLRRRRSLN